MASFDGRVVLVTGAARGQGRSHAVAFARAGADLVLCDLPRPMATVTYPLSGEADLAETVRQVEAEGRRCVARPADVRDPAALAALVDQAVEELGGVHVLCANAGVTNIASCEALTDEMWDEVVGTNLTGVFNSMRAVLPVMLRQRWGRIVVTGSTGSKLGLPYESHYSAAKWGVVGLVKSVALEVATQGVTVNVVCPTAVDTTMIHNDAMYRLFRPDLEAPTRADVVDSFAGLHPQGIPWIDPADVSAAVLFLASEEAGHVTGETLSVSAGMSARNAG